MVFVCRWHSYFLRWLRAFDVAEAEDAGAGLCTEGTWAAFLSSLQELGTGRSPRGSRTLVARIINFYMEASHVSLRGWSRGGPLTSVTTLNESHGKNQQPHRAESE